MPQIQIDYPDDLLNLPGQTAASLERLAREAFLVRLYELGQLSSGRAATLFGVSRREFLDLIRPHGARVLLLDEAYGRRIARHRGLPLVGTLGVLLAAKQAGILPAVGPVIDDMIRQGRRVSARLHAQVLRAAGE